MIDVGQVCTSYTLHNISKSQEKEIEKQVKKHAKQNSHYIS
jgi:hypothetical protein